MYLYYCVEASVRVSCSASVSALQAFRPDTGGGIKPMVLDVRLVSHDAAKMHGVSLHRPSLAAALHPSQWHPHHMRKEDLPILIGAAGMIGKQTLLERHVSPLSPLGSIRLKILAERKSAHIAIRAKEDFHPEIDIIMYYLAVAQMCLGPEEE